MKRFFLFVFTFLLSFALIRSCLGKEPLTFSAFMKALSKLDLDFSNIKKVSEYMAGLKFDTSIDSVSKVFNIIKDFFTVLISPVFFLFALLQDLGSLLVSFIENSAASIFSGRLIRALDRGPVAVTVVAVAVSDNAIEEQK